MAVTLVINNIPFEYPEQGEQQPWGESATAWAEEVTRVLNSVKGVSDLLESRASIGNNQTTFANIQDFLFDSLVVRSFNVSGNLYRKIGTSELFEEFSINGLYQGSAGWMISQDSMGNAGVLFEMTPSGQMRYKSTNMSGDPLTYEGIIKFRGIGISQV